MLLAKLIQRQHIVRHTLLFMYPFPHLTHNYRRFPTVSLIPNPNPNYQHRVQDLLAVTDQEQQLVDHDSLRKPAEKDSRRSEPEARKDTGRPNPQETAERDAAEEFGSEEERGWSAWFTVGVFVHEVWVLLQHANILVNPLCQKLDRNYGVALVSCTKVSPVRSTSTVLWYSCIPYDQRRQCS